MSLLRRVSFLLPRQNFLHVLVTLTWLFPSYKFLSFCIDLLLSSPSTLLHYLIHSKHVQDHLTHEGPFTSKRAWPGCFPGAAALYIGYVTQTACCFREIVPSTWAFAVSSVMQHQLTEIIDSALSNMRANCLHVNLPVHLLHDQGLPHCRE